MSTFVKADLASKLSSVATGQVFKYQTLIAWTEHTRIAYRPTLIGAQWTTTVITHQRGMSIFTKAAFLLGMIAYLLLFFFNFSKLCIIWWLRKFEYNCLLCETKRTWYLVKFLLIVKDNISNLFSFNVLIDILISNFSLFIFL